MEAGPERDPRDGDDDLVSAGGSTNRNPSGASVLVGRIFGHGVTNLTECPGPLLDGLIPGHPPPGPGPDQEVRR